MYWIKKKILKIEAIYSQNEYDLCLQMLYSIKKTLYNLWEYIKMYLNEDLQMELIKIRREW